MITCIWNLHLMYPGCNERLKFPSEHVASPRRDLKGLDQKSIQLSSVVHTLRRLSASCQTGVNVDRPIKHAQEAVPWQIATPKAAKPPPPWGMQRYGTIPMLTINGRRYPLRNLPRPPADQLTYYKVVLPITFHDNDPTFSLTTSSVRGDGPSTPASADVYQSTPELTKTAIATPKSSTPMALEVNHFSLNLTLTTG